MHLARQLLAQEYAQQVHILLVYLFIGCGCSSKSSTIFAKICDDADNGLLDGSHDSSTDTFYITSSLPNANKYCLCEQSHNNLSSRAPYF